MLKSILNFIRYRHNKKKLWRKGLTVKKDKTKRNSELADRADHSFFLGFFMLLVIWGLCSILLNWATSSHHKVSLLVPGQEIPETINAAFDFTYEDREATAKAREEAMRLAPFFYRISENADVKIRNNFNEFFAAVQYRSDPNAPDSQQQNKDSEATKLAAGLDSNSIKFLAQYVRNPASFRYFDNELNHLLNGGILGSADKSGLQVGQNIRIVDTRNRERRPRAAGNQTGENEAALQLAETVLRFYPQNQDRLRMKSDFTAVFQSLLGSAGNLVLDSERTEAGRNAAAANVGVITSEIKKFHPIIRKGEVVTPARLELMKLYNRKSAQKELERGDWKRPARNMFWSMAMVVLAGFYLYHIHPEVATSNRKIWIVGSSIMIALVCNYAGILVFNRLTAQSSELPASLVISAVPVALISIMMATFLGFRVAMCTGFFVATVTTIMLDMSFEFAFKGLVLCSLSALAVRNATNYRAYFVRTLCSVFPLVWLLNSNVMLETGLDWHTGMRIFLWAGALALGNGLVTAMLALLLIFIYELIFNVTTNMSLLLLCDYNHPLLERMKREAPGTFFHSLMLATLAEDAARAINANYLRAKAGALYHDIGKLSKPQYFTENNRNVNWHEELTPQMSSIIIRDHVKEGLALARQYNLVKVVRDAIEQHHGNDLVIYFYRKAQELALLKGEEPVPESLFRYQGPPPKTKETAIISLADACEAACRSLDKPSAGRIESQVNDIFLKRFQNGQLANADITLAELEKIRESFINTLLSMKHGRIAYQTEKEEEEDEDDLFMAARKRGKSEAKA